MLRHPGGLARGGGGLTPSLAFCSPPSRIARRRTGIPARAGHGPCAPWSGRPGPLAAAALLPRASTRGPAVARHAAAMARRAARGRRCPRDRCKADSDGADRAQCASTPRGTPSHRSAHGAPGTARPAPPPPSHYGGLTWSFRVIQAPGDRDSGGPECHAAACRSLPQLAAACGSLRQLCSRLQQLCRRLQQVAAACRRLQQVAAACRRLQQVAATRPCESRLSESMEGAGAAMGAVERRQRQARGGSEPPRQLGCNRSCNTGPRAA
jgi:hypothetical protein